ncbi:hypothetical protein GGX14DRAFT_606853 [Mycena pura]|uniref:Uncharacterized protein n=1 Tax=Mycena pura TaxID=153505 RepID=A0AAD6VKP0_9AGAR|nr:hypothetical protein GGX14DRAFT_606853 [Mycena pura]
MDVSMLLCREQGAGVCKCRATGNTKSESLDKGTRRMQEASPPTESATVMKLCVTRAAACPTVACQRLADVARHPLAHAKGPVNNRENIKALCADAVKSSSLAGVGLHVHRLSPTPASLRRGSRSLRATGTPVSVAVSEGGGRAAPFNSYLPQALAPSPLGPRSSLLNPRAHPDHAAPPPLPPPWPATATATASPTTPPARADPPPPGLLRPSLATLQQSKSLVVHGPHRLLAADQRVAMDSAPAGPDMSEFHAHSMPIDGARQDSGQSYVMPSKCLKQTHSIGTGSPYPRGYGYGYTRVTRGLPTGKPVPVPAGTGAQPPRVRYGYGWWPASPRIYPCRCLGRPDFSHPNSVQVCALPVVKQKTQEPAK